MLRIVMLQFSDHQLKNTSNPEISVWLQKKNMQARRQIRENAKRSRMKQETMLREQVEKQKNKEKALVEYERWKKNKNKYDYIT